MRLSNLLIAFKLYHKALSFLVRQATRSTAIGHPSLFGLLLRTYVKRPEWVYYPGVDPDPVKRFSFLPVRDPREDDLRICRRLIDAYRKACAEAPPMEGVGGPWKGIIRKRYGLLLNILENRDEAALARMLSGLFQQEFLYGISSANLGLIPGYAYFFRMKLVEEILALAEACGVVRTETPEQGVLGFGLSRGLEDLIRKIEAYLGLSMGFPNIGGAYGFQIGETLITPEEPEHIYVAWRILAAMRAFHERTGRDVKHVLEIGAGFGGTAYWLAQLRGKPFEHYTILDLPLINVCQGYFLAKAFGENSVVLHGERLNSASVFHILPPHAKNGLPNDCFELLINENSMPEMPETVVTDYLQMAKAKVSGLFYSYNQEAYSPVNDVPQVLVPEAVQKIGGFKRVSRERSWVRRGYVEEVYVLEKK